MARKKARADGLVEIKRRIDGRDRHFYGRTKREAEEKYKAALAESANLKESGAKFETVAAEWWEQHQKKIKPGTIRAYRGGYQAAVARFSRYGMKEITPGMVNTWGLDFQQQGKAGKTAQNARSILSQIFKYWCVRDSESYNPVNLVDLPRGMKRTERQPPTKEQLQTVKEHPEGFGLCAWLFMYTGCRLGEVLALQWRDIDFDAGMISVTKSVTWINTKPVIQEPKTKNAVRVVPLLRPLRDVLEPRKAKANAFILGGEKPLTSYEYRRAWLAYCESVGLVEIDPKAENARDRKYLKAYGRDRKRKPPETHLYKAAVTAHQFRHEFASAMYEADIGEMEAQKILGHADIATTRKIYTHIREDQIKAAAQKLDSLFSEKS